MDTLSLLIEIDMVGAYYNYMYGVYSIYYILFTIFIYYNIYTFW